MLKTLKLSYLWLFFMTAIVTPSLSQRDCGTDALMEELLQNPTFRLEHEAKMARLLALAKERVEFRATCANTVVLPVAVHFQGISNPDAACLRALAHNQIVTVNADFQGINSDINNWTGNAAAFFPGTSNGEACVEFCLATKNHPAGFGLNDGDPAVTINQTSGDNALAWSGYVNIFVRNISALGYSPLGGSGNGDGVVIDIQAFGTSPDCGVVVPQSPYDLGRTLTHELGHYFSLFHIWGSGTSCADSDQVDDTPNQEGSYGGCPSLGTASCGSTDMHMSYMDYTNDACMYMFSAGQTSRMESYISNFLTNVIANAANVCGGVVNTCNNGVQDGNETGVDCGGSCPPCAPTCTDGIQNGNETGVDCGGSCPPCASTCTDGIQNGNETGVDCGGSCPPCASTCDNGVQDGDETGVDCGGSCPACVTCIDVVLTLVFDNKPKETSWTLTTSNGELVASGGPYDNNLANTTLTTSYCLPAGCYTFLIKDSRRNGMCCISGNGSYQWKEVGSGKILASGGQFGSQETSTFCVTGGGPVEPTCDDGVQNGEETGIDCGGPDCSPCSTCDNGVQDGDETGVDCGGSCAPCPSCEDGIQNGGETGVDCGGPDCPACPPTLCMAPDITSVSVASDGKSATITWNAITGSSRYNLQYREMGTTRATNKTVFGTSFTITGLKTNTTYEYRLRAYCNNNYTEYSEWFTFSTGTARLAHAEEQGNVVKIFPNPTSSTLSIRLNAQSAGPVDVFIHDLLGRKVLVHKHQAAKGENLIDINVQHLVPAFYQISFIVDGKTVTKDFVMSNR